MCCAGQARRQTSDALKSWENEPDIPPYELYVARYDVGVAKLVQRQTPDKVIQCKAGCSACCYYVVTIGQMEALALAKYVRSINADTPAFREDLQDRATLMRQHMSAQLHHQRGYTAMRVPCVFLKDAKCSVYDIRPPVCRSHLVITDPKHCETNDGKKLNDGDLMKQHGDHTRAYRRWGTHTGPTHGPLPEMVLWALRYLEESED